MKLAASAATPALRLAAGWQAERSCTAHPSTCERQGLTLYSLPAGLAVHCLQTCISSGVLPAAGHLWAGHGLWAGGGHRGRHRAGRPALCIQVGGRVVGVGRGGTGWSCPQCWHTRETTSATNPPTCPPQLSLHRSYSKVTMTAFTVVPSRSGAGVSGVCGDRIGGMNA